jgi:ribosomal-protein-alanine N-acetyltransferase
MGSASEITVRDMLTSDISEVMSIERHAQIMPWSRLSFEESMNNDYLCRLILLDEKISAFHVVSPVLDELHILTLAVAPEQQGQGLGHAVMYDIVTISNQLGLNKIFLEVRASNQVATSLYQKWQFKQLAIRKNYYTTNEQQREDALVMVRVES